MPINKWDELNLHALTIRDISFLKDVLQSCCGSRDVRGFEEIKCVYFVVLGFGFRTVEDFER